MCCVFFCLLCSTNPLFLCVKIILTFGLYICLRRKVYGGIHVTSRRVMFISGVKAATGETVKFQQVSYFVSVLSPFFWLDSRHPFPVRWSGACPVCVLMVCD